MAVMKVFVISDLSPYALAHSYMRALAADGVPHSAFDVGLATRRYMRLGRVGRELHRFLPVEAWTRKGNRELALECIRAAPDLVLVFGNAPVLYGTLALIRASLPAAKLVLYWPDTLLNLGQAQSSCAPLYDGVATYSKATIPVFERIGFRKAIWIPFGADPDFLGFPTAFDGEFEYDLSFAGGWRPEREAAMRTVRRRLPQARLAIFGQTWLRSCTDPDLRRVCAAKEVVGRYYGDMIRRSRVTLNQIDDTNYPGANMRFFEVPAAGGLQLSSSCPEMADELRDREHLLYYGGQEELAAKLEWILSNPDGAARIRRAGHERAVGMHTYRRRMSDLAASLEVTA